MTSRSSKKAKRQTCLDSKLIICSSTTKTVAQPLLAQTSHLFQTVLISSDTPSSSFQVFQQLRLTEPCLFMVSPVTCMEVGTCTISLSISETLDLLVLFHVSHQKGKSSLATTTTSSFTCCYLLVFSCMCYKPKSLL